MSSLKRITVLLSFLLQTSPAANSEEKRLFSQATSYTHQERSNFLFNNEILSDVKFVVPSSQHGECSDQKKKQDGDPSSQVFVGNQKSCIFFAMFCGKMAETEKEINMPDCDYDGTYMFELLRFLYTDKVCCLINRK